MQNISNRNSDKTVKTLLFIPLGSIILGLILFIIACILEKPTSRGTVYSICMIVSLLSCVLAVFPGAILSIIGTVKAAKEKMIKYIILGIVEIISASGGVFLLWFIVYVAGPGV